MELEMKTEGKKLEFYTGRWVSFLPFIIFLGMIIVSVVLDAVSERSMWICCIVGLMIAFFLAKDKIRYGDAIAEGIAQKLTSVPVLCWIFAGIFTTTLRAAGLVQGIVWVAYNVGAHGMLFVLVAFISCAAFATAAGTGLGTTIAGISILYPAGCLLGANPLVLAGAIIGGGAFGDNLAPVSDTTICSALTQGADITGVVKSRLRYSAVAAAITILFILFFGGGGSITGEALPHDLIAEYMNPKGLLMLIPAILTIYLAIKKGDVIYACIAGTAAVIVVALPTGLLTLSDIICLSDGGVSGTLVDGIGGMADIVILCLLVMGMVGVMKAGEGDKLLIDIATKVIRGVCGAELSIVILSAILAGMTGINTFAIFTTLFYKQFRRDSTSIPIAVPICWMPPPALWHTLCPGPPSRWQPPPTPLRATPCSATWYPPSARKRDLRHIPFTSYYWPLCCSPPSPAGVAVLPDPTVRSQCLRSPISSDIHKLLPYHMVSRSLTDTITATLKKEKPVEPYKSRVDRC